MQLNNSFTVPAPVDVAWSALMDLEEVAGCVPGATLESTNGDEFSGKVRVKVGPVHMTYNGSGRFIERDETSHRALIHASGKEAKGSGAAQAEISAALHECEEGTRVNVSTDLGVTGKAAQFGRGVMEDVSTRIFNQFAHALAQQLAAPAPSALVASTPDSTNREVAPPVQLTRQAPEAIDLMSVAGGAIARRLVLPVLAIVIAVGAFVALR